MGEKDLLIFLTDYVSHICRKFLKFFTINKRRETIIIEKKYPLLLTLLALIWSDFWMFICKMFACTSYRLASHKRDIMVWNTLATSCLFNTTYMCAHNYYALYVISLLPLLTPNNIKIIQVLLNVMRTR